MLPGTGRQTRGPVPHHQGGSMQFFRSPRRAPHFKRAARVAIIAAAAASVAAATLATAPVPAGAAPAHPAPAAPASATGSAVGVLNGPYGPMLVAGSGPSAGTALY